MHTHPPSRKTSTGWTLIEVMVALVIIACISALGYRGISTLITTESHLREESERLLILDTTFAQVSADWNAQTASLPPPPPPLNKADAPPTLALDPSQWAFTPIQGWIPSPEILPRTPPPLEPYLTKRYIVSYQANTHGGVERSIGCTQPAPSLASTQPTLTVCQRWHLLGNLPILIDGAASTDPSKPKQMHWNIQTAQGTIERLWSLPASPPALDQGAAKNLPPAT